MAPTAKKGDVAPEEGTQAVVLCDVWGPGLAPLALDTPACLLPVAGVPAIEYTLQFLADGGVAEVLLFCAAGAGALRRYLEASRWAAHLVAAAAAAAAPAPGAPEPATPRVRVLTAGAVSSAGDALRAVDSMGVLRSEAVVLVDGPVVANFQLRAALASHAERAKADANAILTVLVTQQPPAAPLAATPAGGAGAPPPLRRGSSGPLCEELRLTLNTDDGRIVAYELAHPASAAYPPAVGARARATDTKAAVRTDLADSRVYIAGHEVFIHFTDNYDYQHVRGHYIHNEVLNVDMGFRFSAHLLVGPDVYAGVLADCRALAAISADVAAGRCAPYTPAACWWAPPTLPLQPSAALPAPAAAAAALLLPPAALWSTGGSSWPGAWVQHGACVSPLAVLSPGSVVFAGATVEAGARVSGSIVGARAAVRAGACLSGALVFAAAVVGADARVGRAIVGSGAQLGAGCCVPDGCVLGAGVAVGAGHALPPFSRVTTAAPATSGGSAKGERVTAAGSDAAVVGVAGVGRAWPAGGDELDGLDEGDAGSDDDEDADGDDGGDDDGRAAAQRSFDAQHAGAAMLAVRAALRALSAAQRAARAHGDDGSDGGSVSADADAGAAAVTRALAELAAATRAALGVPLLVGSAGTQALEACVPLLAAVPKPAAAAVAPTAAASKAAAAAAAAATSAAAGDGAVARFAAGVAEILTAASARASDARSLAMEVKSFRFSENRTSVDCMRAVLPLVLDRIPREAPKAFISGIKTVLGEWAPLLQVFDEGAETERAAVDAAQAYVLEPRNAGLPRELFGVIVSELWELDVTTDTAVTEWLEDAEASGDPAVASLLAAKWTQWLLQQLDEDEDEEDEEDEDEEDAADD